jgi:hypothetical protein
VSLFRPREGQQQEKGKAAKVKMRRLDMKNRKMLAKSNRTRWQNANRLFV